MSQSCAQPWLRGQMRRQLSSTERKAHSRQCPPEILSVSETECEPTLSVLHRPCQDVPLTETSPVRMGRYPQGAEPYSLASEMGNQSYKPQNHGAKLCSHCFSSRFEVRSLKRMVKRKRMKSFPPSSPLLS